VTLSTILNAERIRQGLTVYRLSLLTGIAQPPLTRFLADASDRCEFGTVVKVLDGLGKSLTWLDRQMKSED
jgi:hypothetical protein